MAESVKHGGTLFISNVSYTTASADLEASFSNLAPVRNAFVVPGKGVGYVTFAISEDAARVFETVQKDGLVVGGRPLRVGWPESRKKRPLIDQEETIQVAPQLEKKPRLHDRDPDATRTVVVLNLPPSVNQKQLWKKARKYSAQSVVYPFLEDPSLAKFIFETPAQASSAVPHLHNHTFKGTLIGAMLKKKWDSVVSAKAKPGRAGRLIIRNLPWNITEEALRKCFTPFGPLSEVHIPSSARSSEISTKPLASGFAFVTFVSVKDAERAIEGLDGTTLKTAAAKDGAETSGRKISVQLAISKEKWKQEKQEDTSSGTEDSDAESTDEISVDHDSEGSDSEDSVHQDAEDDDLVESNSDDAADVSEPVKRHLPDPSDGATIFVRNVPYEATAEELKALFSQHGPVIYAVLTMDRDTSPPRPRGTAFVCFRSATDANKVIDLGDRVRQLATTHHENPFKQAPSLLTPDPSSATVLPLVLHGRTLDVAKAVARSEANDFERARALLRREDDKRGLWLLKECVPNPRTSPLPPKHIDALLDSYRARKKSLDSNPLLYVSGTRLSIRGLEKWVSERALRKWLLWILGEWEKDVASGLREDIESELGLTDVSGDRRKAKRKVVQIKIMRDATRMDTLSVSGKAKSGKSKGFAFVELSKVADALKIIRWCLTPRSAETTSRGSEHPKGNNAVMLDFWIEELEEYVKKFKSDEDAKEKDSDQSNKLKVVQATLDDLKKTTSARKTDSLDKHLIVEFAIENKQVVRTRTLKQHTKEPAVAVIRGSGGKPMFDGAARRHGRRPVDGQEANSSRSHEQNKERHARKRQSQQVDLEKNKTGRGIGSLIGRKRRERRTK